MKKKILIWFMNHGAEITDEHKQFKGTKFLDISFGSNLQIRFEKDSKGLRAINGVDGYGNNMRTEIEGKYAEIFESITTGHLWLDLPSDEA